MKKIAIILLLIALTSCVASKKDYSKEQPIQRTIVLTLEEKAEMEAEDKLYERIDKLHKLGILTGNQYQDPLKQIRYDIMMIMMLDKCAKIKNDKARQKCSERVFNENGGINYIEGI